MEASWPGASLKLEDQTLVLALHGGPAFSIPVQDIVEFSVVPTRSVARGRKAASSPDAAFVVGWRKDGQTQWGALPVPRESLQFQLFLTRLGQLRPDADHRDSPTPDALRQIRSTMRARFRFLGLFFAGLFVLLLLFLLSLGMCAPK